MDLKHDRGQWRVIIFGYHYTDKELLSKTKAELVSLIQGLIGKGKSLEEDHRKLESRIDELEFKLKEADDINTTLLEQVDQLHSAAKALLGIMAHEEIIYDPDG